VTRELVRWADRARAGTRGRWRDARWREGLLLGVLTGFGAIWLYDALSFVPILIWTALVAIGGYRLGRGRTVTRARAVGIDRRFNGETFVLYDDGHEERVA